MPTLTAISLPRQHVRRSAPKTTIPKEGRYFTPAA
jgi:hypothetical protein